MEPPIVDDNKKRGKKTKEQEAFDEMMNKSQGSNKKDGKVKNGDIILEIPIVDDNKNGRRKTKEQTAFDEMMKNAQRGNNK